MKLRSLAAVAALSTALFAGAALADGRIAAALDQPLVAKTKVDALAIAICHAHHMGGARARMKLAAG